MIQKFQRAPFLFIEGINATHELQNLLLIMFEFRNGGTNGFNLAQYDNLKILHKKYKNKAQARKTRGDCIHPHRMIEICF